MSKEKFKELLSDERSGGEVKPPGLSLDKVIGDIGSTLKHLGAQGAHEMAAALFQGNAFVMYPGEPEQAKEGHGLPEQEQDRGGREM